MQVNWQTSKQTLTEHGFLAT